MIKRAVWLLGALLAVACAQRAPSDRPAMPVSSDPTPDVSLSNVPALPADAPRVSVETDREAYHEGESLFVTIGNHSSRPVQFALPCGLHLCRQMGDDWVCVEQECDGPPTVLDPGQELALSQEARPLGRERQAGEQAYRYKLDYQAAGEPPFFFAHSNAFTIESGSLGCRQAREVALEHARSTPFSDRIDTSRVTVRWQDAGQACVVDFAWREAEEMAAGMWSEGYAVSVSVRSGHVQEAHAYER